MKSFFFQENAFENVICQMSAAKCQPFCSELNVLMSKQGINDYVASGLRKSLDDIKPHNLAHLSPEKDNI